MMRTSTLIGCALPRRSIDTLLQHAEQLDLDLRRQLADFVEEERGLLAASKRPICRDSAPVYAPRSRPNSSLSMSALGMAAQLTRIIGR